MTQSDKGALIRYQTVVTCSTKASDRLGSRRPPDVDLLSAAAARGSDPRAPEVSGISGGWVVQEWWWVGGVERAEINIHYWRKEKKNLVIS